MFDVTFERQFTLEQPWVRIPVAEIFLCQKGGLRGRHSTVDLSVPTILRSLFLYAVKLSVEK